MLTTQDYQSALSSQSACNLSGLAHALAEVLPRLWDQARAMGKGTDFLNTHPIVRLFVTQMAHLAFCGQVSVDDDLWFMAHAACEHLAQEMTANAA